MPLQLVDRAEAIGLVTCPNCNVTMRCVALKPVEGEAELSEAAYRCPRCDAGTTRWVRP